MSANNKAAARTMLNGAADRLDRALRAAGVYPERIDADDEERLIDARFTAEQANRLSDILERAQ